MQLYNIVILFTAFSFVASVPIPHEGHNRKSAPSKEASNAQSGSGSPAANPDAISAAQKINRDAQTLKLFDSCSAGTNACIGRSKVTCSETGKWLVQGCNKDGEQPCHAVPDVSGSGVKLECTSRRNALSIFQAAGGQGGLTGEDGDEDNGTGRNQQEQNEDDSDRNEGGDGKNEEDQDSETEKPTEGGDEEDQDNEPERPTEGKDESEDESGAETTITVTRTRTRTQTRTVAASQTAAEPSATPTSDSPSSTTDTDEEETSETETISPQEASSIISGAASTITAEAGSTTTIGANDPAASSIIEACAKRPAECQVITQGAESVTVAGATVTSSQPRETASVSSSRASETANAPQASEIPEQEGQGAIRVEGTINPLPRPSSPA